MSLKTDAMTKISVAGAAFALLPSLFATSTLAGPVNASPPAGAILNLSGTPIPHTTRSYSVDFTATSNSTTITFAFRDDPAYITFTDASVVNVTTASSNILLNGGFTGGDYTNSGNTTTPVDWTYDNQYGAVDGGVGENGYWYDGSVQAYDAISQAITTISGDTYDITFDLSESSSLSTFSALSTNGDTADYGGNGVNALVYAQAGAPAPASVPEPASLTLFGAGLGGLGWLRRRKARSAA